ncbi:MAG: hypothetical protein R3F23_01930 [Verrucomicrobiia bacterium]
MNKIYFSLFLFLILSQLQGQVLSPNVLANGDFTKGKAGWQGEGRIVKIKEGKENTEGNPALVINLDKKKEQSFHCLAEIPKGTKSVKLSFKILTSEDYEVQESQPLITILRAGTAQYDALIRRQALEKQVEWQEKRASISPIATERMGIVVTIRPGKGKVYFDDLVAEARAD